MARIKRPNTAIVEIKARVPKGMTATQFKRFIQNNLDTVLYPDWMEEQVIGAEVVNLRVGKARIERKVT